VSPRLEDDAAEVRGAAIWAARRLLDPDAFAGLSDRLAQTETDAAVLDELGVAD